MATAAPVFKENSSTSTSSNYTAQNIKSGDPSPQSQSQAMSPHASPAPHRYSDGSDLNLKFLSSPIERANKVASPLAAAAAHAIATSRSTTSAYTQPSLVTAPATMPSLDNFNGRPVIDPGLPGYSEMTAARAYSFPAASLENVQTPDTARNYTLPGSSTNSTGKKHRCNYCQTEFTRHHNLKSHLLTHSKEKPFQCPECEARFRRLHDLKRHAKLHTGERNHQCRTCHRKFARGDALARHAKGPGGCAGRRPSLAEDLTTQHASDSSMNIEFTAEPGSIDDRANRPNARSDSFRPSNYPEINPSNLNSQQLYAVTGGARSPDLSISSPGALAHIQQFNQSGIYQPSVTDSPKPISPMGVVDPLSRVSASSSLGTHASAQSSLTQPVVNSAAAVSSSSHSANSASSRHDPAIQGDLRDTVYRLEANLDHMVRQGKVDAETIGEQRRQLDQLMRQREEDVATMVEQKRELELLQEEVAQLRRGQILK